MEDLLKWVNRQTSDEVTFKVFAKSKVLWMLPYLKERRRDHGRRMDTGL